MAVRGRPKWVHSDPGSQLKKAAFYLADKDNSGELEIAALVEDEEQAVKALKETLDQVTAGNKLNYAELFCLLQKVANIINDRPLGLRRLDEEVCQALTPNMLLLGRTSTMPLHDVEYENSDKYSHRVAFIEELERLWWNMWYTQCFDGLVPFQRNSDAKISANIKEGDICLLKYQGKIDKGDYRLCRVVQTMPDDKNLVRKVVVEMRPRNSRESTLPYASKDLVKQIVTIQRLVVLPTEPDNYVMRRERLDET